MWTLLESGHGPDKGRGRPECAGVVASGPATSLGAGDTCPRCTPQQEQSLELLLRHPNTVQVGAFLKKHLALKPALARVRKARAEQRPEQSLQVSNMY